MGCDNCGGGYYMDTAEAARRVEVDTTTTGNQSSNMYGFNSDVSGGDDRSNEPNPIYNADGSRKKPPIKDSDSSTKFYK